MSEADHATDLAMLDLSVLLDAGVEVDPEITNEVLLARVGPAIARDLMRPSPLLEMVRRAAK